MSSSRYNRQRLIDLLTNYMSKDNREAIVRSAFYDTNLLQRINFDGAPYNFTERLVTTALSYEKLETTGEFAVIALIDETLRYIGAGSIYTEFQALRARLQEELSGQSTSQTVQQETPLAPETPSVTSKIDASPTVTDKSDEDQESVNNQDKNTESENNQTPVDNSPVIITPTPEAEKKWKNIFERNSVFFTFLGVVVTGLVALAGAFVDRGVFDPVPTEIPAITATIETEEPTDMPIIIATDVPDTPTNTPQQSADTSQTTTSTTAPIAIPDGDTNAEIFLDEDSLTLYIAESTSLANFGYQVGNSEPSLLSDYDSFDGILNNAPAGYCFRLLRSSEEPPLPQTCEFAKTITRLLSNSDIFWYGNGNFRTLIIIQNGETIGICGASQPGCEVTLP